MAPKRALLVVYAMLCAAAAARGCGWGSPAMSGAEWADAGDRYFTDCKYGEAILAYRNARSAAPDGAISDPSACREGYSLLRLAEYAQARSVFERLAGTARYGRVAAFYLAYIAYVEGDYRQALEQFAVAEGDGELAQAARYYKCQMAFAQGKVDQAVSQGRDILATSPPSEHDGELHRIIGEGEYHNGNYQEAQEHIGRYIAAYESEPERTSLYILGVTAFRRRGYEECVRLMLPVADRTDDALAQSALIFIGQSLLLDEGPEASAKAFGRAMLMPFDSQARQTALYNFALSQSDDEFALRCVGSAAKATDTLAAAKQLLLYHLGIKETAGGDVQKAQVLFAEAYGLSDLDPALRNECCLWLGECQCRLGDYKAAEKSLARYIRNADDNAENLPLAYSRVGHCRLMQGKPAQETERQQAAARAASAEALPAPISSSLGYSRWAEPTQVPTLAPLMMPYKYTTTLE